MQLAIEGLAIARRLFSGSDEQVRARIDGMRSVLRELDNGDTDAMSNYGVEVKELSLLAGYDLWAPSYDAFDNALLAFEQPIVQRLVGSGPWGDVLDACTGTGRQLAWLAADATSVTGLDQSPGMLAVAKAKIPTASFLLGSLCDDHDGELPDASFDLVVCSLALTHFADIDEPIATLARLVRPGGRIVLSDRHPFFATLDQHAFFPHDDGSTPFLRQFDHSVSDYLRAFRHAGLLVEECVEPRLGSGDGPVGSGVMSLIAPDANREAYAGLPYILAWSLRRPGKTA